MPTSLSTQQRRRLHDALLDTFKDIGDLEQLATYGLDANLSAIVVVHGRNLTKIVAGLIRWSESEPGGIHRLIAAALDRVPESHELRTIADEWAEIEFRVRPTRETEQTRRIFAWIIGGTVAAIVLGVLVVFNWGQIQKTIQALNPPRVSPLEFGIAVADFGILEEDDSVRYSNDSSKAASESVVGRLQGIYDEIADQTNYAVPADIRYNHGDDPKPFRPSFFRGQTKEEREGKAHRLSKNLNVRLVIYGELEESEPVDMASFRFFMSDKLLVTGTFDYLQHFTGSHGLGKPFAYEFETSLDETNKQIDLRLRTLLWLTRAIQVYATDSTDALNLLDQAEKNILENYGERGEEPLELIYLLRGFIQIELKDPDAAAESFKTALEIRPDMHRARIGMGSVHFLNTFDFSQSEEDKLKEIDRAIEYYEGALEDISPDNREEHTYAQLALGIGLTWRASYSLHFTVAFGRY